MERLRAWLARWLLRAALALLLAALPFYLLVRGSLLATSQWGWHAWLAVGLGAALAALAASGAVWWGLRRLSVEVSRRAVATRLGLPLVVFFCAFCLHLPRSNAKSDEIHADYAILHPALRLAVGTLRLLDGRIVLTDAERVRASYAQMRLPLPAHSSHFRQQDGTIHAIDLRTKGRGWLRNGLVQLYFELLGFDTMRHVGTADHLHVYLPGVRTAAPPRASSKRTPSPRPSRGPVAGSGTPIGRFRSGELTLH